MNYRKHTVNGITLHIVEDKFSKLRLLQSDSAKCSLSALRYGTDKPEAIINCSYFTTEYAIGRDQGDVRQNTSGYTDKGWLGFAMREKDYISGKLEWWDAENSICGFTPACICIEKGEDVQLYTQELATTYSHKMSLATGITLMGITKEGNAILVTGEKGLTSYDALDYLKTIYKLDFLCVLDGGGSSQMLVNGEWKMKGDGRKMFNGLAFVQDDSELQTATLVFKDDNGKEIISCVTTTQLDGSHINLCGANDFAGRDANDRVTLLAPCDVKCTAYASYDNAFFFESVNKVKTPSGPSKIWLMCAHMLDTDIKKLGIEVGKTYRQFEPIYREGNKGLGGGYHAHTEVGFGSFSGGSVPYKWNGEYFKLDGKSYKQYIPCTNGKERPIEEVLYLKNVEIVPRKSTGKTILDFYPMKYVPGEEPISNDAIIMDLKSQVAELELTITTEKKFREIAEQAVKELREKIERLKEVLDE